MSPRLRSELRLRLGARRCVAEVWRPGFARHPAVQVACHAGEPGVDDDLLGAALARLQAERVRLPRTARLVVDDDSLYAALLPADAAWGSGLAHAQRYFEGALDSAALQVAVTLAPCGRRWLAVALERPWLDAVEQALKVHAVRLADVSSALLQDLDQLARHTPREGLVVLVREAGLVLLRRERGHWTDLRWERCDGGEPEAVAHPVSARAWREGGTPVLLVAEQPAAAARLEPLAQARGWSLTALNPGAAA